MDSSESLHLDENLARLLAAYDHHLDEADGHAPTIDVRPLQGDERPVEPLSGSDVNRGSLSDLLPDRSRGDSFVPSPFSTPETHRVGRFELRKQLGRGGCGIVFLAHDPKLKRDVALKIPRPELMMSPDARKRLVREATAAAAFDHPNLVPVYETGEIGPVCFIATVFCPGITLSEWLERQAFPVPIRQTARLVALLGEAVQHAHERGVLHRDLKPNNVILQEVKSDPNQQDAPPGACPLRGDYFTPRIVDFGLAKLADSGPSETATRQVLGTPKYMAPEQAQARHEDVGPEADVYALGGILYEMLTGRAPYEGATDVEVLRQCIEGNLTPPRHLRKDIPRDLEAICLKAMERYPSRRYRTSIDFADDLRRFLDGRPTLARPLNAMGRGSRWLRRNDQLFALIVVSTISLVLLASGLWNAYQSQRLQSTQDEAQFQEAGRLRMENARKADKHVRDAFHSWQAGQREPMLRSLLEAKYAFGLSGSSSEFATWYLTNRERQTSRAVGGSPPRMRSVAVSPDGKWLATGHADGALRIWSRETRRIAFSSEASGSAMTRVRFSREDRVLTQSGSTLYAWLVNAGGEAKPAPLEPQERFESETVCETSVARYAAMPAMDGAVMMTHRTGGAERTLPGAGSPIRSLTAAVSSGWVAALGEDQSLCIWELAEGTFRLHRDFDSPLYGLAFSPHGDALYLAAEDGLHVLAPTSDPAGFALDDRSASVTAVSLHGEGTAFAAAYADGRVEVFSARESPPKTLEAAGRRPISVLRHTARGIPLGVEHSEDRVSVWEFGEAAKPMRSHAIKATAVDLSPGGESLAVGDSQGRVTVWSVANGERLGEIDTKRGGPVYGLSFSDNGRWLAVPLEGNAVGLWFVSENTIELKVAGHSEGTARFRFLGDDRLATAGRGSSIKVWSLQSLREEWTLLGHSGRITSLVVSPDQRTLASAAANGEVIFWDLRTGYDLMAMKRHRGPVSAAEFSPSGRHLLTGSSFRGRGELAFWDADKE